MIIDIEIAGSAKNFVEQLKLLDAIHFIKRALDPVSPEVVKNCFHKAGLTVKHQGGPRLRRKSPLQKKT